MSKSYLMFYVNLIFLDSAEEEREGLILVSFGEIKVID